MQNDDLLVRLLRQPVHSFAEVNFFRDEQLTAEAAQFSECPRLTKDERSRHPAPPSAQTIPGPDKPDRPANSLIELNCCAAANAPATLNLRRHVGEQFGAGKGICVHKNKPFSVCRRRSGVARPRDLIDGLKEDASTLRPGEFPGSIRRVVVTDDNFKFPANL